MTYRAALAIAVMLALPVATGGCTMTTPSQVRTGDIQLERGVDTHTYDTAMMTEGHVRAVAREYERVGRGPLNATVSYDAARAGDLQVVQRDMNRILGFLRNSGVPKADVNYVAVNDRRTAGQVVFSYPAMKARAPEHCTRLPGYQGAEGLDAIQSYQISCETKDVMSKMVVTPEDLLGRDGRNSATSRRAGAIVETYQDGEPNENFYDIKSASEVGQ